MKTTTSKPAKHKTQRAKAARGQKALVDLDAAGATTRGVKGGSSVSDVLNGIFKAVNTAASKVG